MGLRPPPFEPRPEDEVRDALRLLHASGDEARTCVATTLDWLNGVESARDLLEEVARHPVRDPVFPQPPIRPGIDAQRIALGILAARADLGGRFTNVLEVASVRQVDVNVLAALINVGCELAAGPPVPPPPPIVAVLLPLRLETRFYAPENAGAAWMMKVRVVPDAASLDRHQPLASAAELDATEQLWRDADGDLTTDVGRAQWTRFCARVGGAGRAAWLARTFPAVPDGASWTITRPAETRDDLATSRLAGLPPALELWIARGGAAPDRIATMNVDETKLTLEFPDPDLGEARWWSSFAEAKAAGLAVEVDMGPAAPTDIDALYVVGVGDKDPTELFTNHRDAGILGVLDLGVPTNTVAGEPAADLARDPETWRTLLTTGGGAQSGAREASAALTGSDAALVPLPGGDVEVAAVNQAMVRALWSAVWGHGLNDVWSLAGQGFSVGEWACENLLPEGPIPPLRIGDQPYGVLPITSLARWKPAVGDPAIEEPLRNTLVALRRASAVAGEARGTTAGADTARLLDLLGAAPASRNYSWRWLLPLELVHALWWAFGSGVQWTKLAAWWDDLARPVTDLGATPARRYTTLGWFADLDIPLVAPDNLAMSFEQAIARILSFPPQALASEGRRRELFQPWPNSLLLRLLVHARVVDAAEVARAVKADTGPLLDPIVVDSKEDTLLHRWGVQFNESELTSNVQTLLWELGRKGMDALASQDLAVLERVFRATLDTASHRIDPWVNGIAWRRLRDFPATGRTAKFVLGAYGWVDAPAPRIGPQPAEYLHAPSEAQSLTSAILRDRARFDAEPGRWQIDLDSDGVRLADQLAAEVRLGAHLSEAVGRAVERAVGTRADVERLRRDFPIRTEHAGRRVCDGLAVLDRYATNPAALLLAPAQLDGIAAIAEAIDTYGDLLVADAVFDVVSGRASLAAQSMDAAAGLDLPPALDVLHTQRSGRTVNTTVVVALPDADAPAVVDVATSPGALAEPAVAAFLAAAVGAPASAAWTWDVVDENDAVVASVTLAAMDLEPIDTLSLSPGDLASAAIATAGAGVAVRTTPPAHDRCRRLSDVLGSRPVVPADLTPDMSQPSDLAVHADLLARYTAVHALATDVQSALVAAGGGAEADQRAALHDAMKWGITPLTADEPALGVLVSRALAALTDRIGHAPAPADTATLSVPLLARALAELVSPEGRLPVLSRLAIGDLPVTLATEPPPGNAPALDPDWLEVVGAVRAPLGRLEVEQLTRRVAGGTPLASWSSRAGDPWQVDLGADPPVIGLAASSHLVAAFGPDGTIATGDPTRVVALGLLDSWGEVIPSTEHATQVAFNFDAPGARAQQAILVAVPPDIDTPLDTETIITILGETRELTRARATVPADVDAWSTAEPLTVLPVYDPGVDLERTP